MSKRSRPNVIRGAALLTLAVCGLPGSAVAAGSVDFAVTGSIAVPTCRFDTRDVDFDFGQISAADLPLVGSVTRFIERKWGADGCHPSINNLWMRFEGTADADRNELIAAEGGSQGVAIDLQSFDNKQSVPDNATEMRWSPRSTSETYDFKARVVRTRAAMRGGEIRATVVVHIRYD